MQKGVGNDETGLRNGRRRRVPLFVCVEQKRQKKGIDIDIVPRSCARSARAGQERKRRSDICRRFRMSFGSAAYVHDSDALVRA
jgi:hypothetical protein